MDPIGTFASDMALDVIVFACGLYFCHDTEMIETVEEHTVIENTSYRGYST